MCCKNHASSIPQIQIGTDGYLLFGVAQNTCCPSLFPGDPPWQYTIAPFAADGDTSSGRGEVSYEIHTLAAGSEFLSKVNRFIRQEKLNRFGGNWMLVVDWNQIPQSGGPTFLVSFCYKIYLYYL